LGEVRAIHDESLEEELERILICHGLTSASHLNGKSGDVRANHNDRNEIRLAVHFETKSLKPSLVKPENLRIAFELPKEV
jgi:hypothetical protein